MIEVRFEVVGAFDGGIYEPGAVPAESLEEGARVAAVLGARLLIGRVECAESAVRPKVGTVPEIHHAENRCLDAPPAGGAIALEQMQFFEPLENPEGEIDFDAVRIEDPAIELVGQSFANQKLVDFRAPARSRILNDVSREQSQRICWPFHLSSPSRGFLRIGTARLNSTNWPRD